MQLPNVLIFIVDDLGWNQVGYHARRVDNTEIDTPNIDQYATVEGVEMNRGYMTPWCGPSRASLLTGRTNSYNPNITNCELVPDGGNNVFILLGASTPIGSRLTILPSS